MFKKLVPAILVVAMMFTVSACGKKIRGGATKTVKQVKNNEPTILEGNWIQYASESRTVRLNVTGDLMIIDIQDADQGDELYYTYFMVSEKNGKRSIMYLDEYYNPTYSETFEYTPTQIVFENGDQFNKQ